MLSIGIRALAAVAALALAAPILAAPAPAHAQDLDAKQREHLYYRVKPGVVFVLWQAQMDVIVDGRRSTQSLSGAGSGWIITPDGYVVTNGHVIRGYHDRVVTEADLMIKAARESGLLQGLSDAEQLEAIHAALPERLQNELGLTPIQPRAPGARAGAAAPRVRRIQQASALTNQLHVVLQNGRSFPADVRAYSPPMGVVPGKVNPRPGDMVQAGRDVAVVKIAGSDLPVVRLGNSDRVELGATIHAAGYPGVVSDHPLLSQATQLQASFTEGRISSLKVDVEGASLLQMTAPTTWGNSGGPVFNDAGEVVGMATLGSIANRPIQQAVQGFNFAVPVNTVREFVMQAGVDLSKESLFTRVWERALDHYFAGRYTEANSDINRALSLLPGMPDGERIRRFAIESSERGVTSPPEITATQPEPAPGTPVAEAPAPQQEPGNNWPWLVGGLLALALMLVPVGLVMRRRNPAAAVRAAPAQRSLPGSAAGGHLVINSGPQRGNRLAIPVKGLTIGRDPTRNQLVLSDEAVSRTHALVLPSGESGTITVRNLSHTNPTLVNDQPVEEVTLRAGDRIKVGNSVIVYEQS